MFNLTRYALEKENESVEDVMVAVETVDTKKLVIFNDDVNTFDHVINILVKVCKHSVEQAEQCAIIIHYKGQCPVKAGTFEILKPMKEAICEAGIDGRIL